MQLPCIDHISLDCICPVRMEAASHVGLHCGVTSCQEVLELYFSPRVLCVSSEEVSALRVLVWRLCIAQLFGRQLLDGWLAIHSRHVRGDSLGTTRYLASLIECKKYISSGRSLLVSRSRPTAGKVTPPLELTVLSEAVEVAITLLRTAYTCNDVGEAAHLRNELERFATMGIKLSDEYAYAKVHSLARLYMPLRVHADVASPGDKALVHAPRYCWCAGIDNGEPMVGCDKCGEWFHYSCVGIVSRTHMKSLKENEFECIACCTMKTGRRYRYEWTSSWYGSEKKEIVVKDEERHDDIVLDSREYLMECQPVSENK